MPTSDAHGAPSTSTPQPQPRRLIVNADDFGRGVGISRGIITAHQRGIVTSTTCMVNLPWSVDAAQQAAATPTLAIGLHLAFCYGPPLADPAEIASLLDADGNLMRDLPRLATQMQPEHIEREARTQFAHFHALFGRAPSHLDSHQHVHGFATAAPVILRLAREWDLPMRASHPAQATAAAAVGVPTPHPVNVAFFGAPANLTVDALSTILRDLPPGTSELMCHPGYVDTALDDSSYRTQRELEITTLCDPAIRALLADEQITLATFADLTC